MIRALDSLVTFTNAYIDAFCIYFEYVYMALLFLFVTSLLPCIL